MVFAAGYIAIASEHSIRINKAASALITGVVCWTIYMLSSSSKELADEQLTDALGELSGILFFLLGAMTIVELIDAHNGFGLITDQITQKNKRKLLWIVSFITFFLSPLLDNLTTTIVMISLVRRLIDSQTDRLYFSGMIIIAANAGGAWSPIGDVTTTMLWIGGQVTAGNITQQLFIPSLLCMILPLTILSLKLKGDITAPVTVEDPNARKISRRTQKAVLICGILILMMVPVFKTLTHMPPYMGMLLGLGLLWVITELVHGKRDEGNRRELSVARALQKIDTPSILFFLGILISIDALKVTGILGDLAGWMNTEIGNLNLIAMSMGLLSSIVDNVPLVAATQGMYHMADFPTDHFLWEFLAYTTGTGGSALVIGSAAGVAAMGMEQIGFMWYLKKITPVALLGFFAGAVYFIFQHNVLG